jgi:predicted dehydrogenase
MIRVGVVGLGFIGREHLAVYQQLSGVEVTAVADFDRGIAESVAEDAGVRAFGSAEEMLAAGVVDAISLATPDQLHFDDAIRIIRSGTHLLLEKPIATTGTEADLIADTAESFGVVAVPGHTLRYSAHYIAAKALYESGDLGEVVHGYIRRNNKISVADRVRGRISVAFFLGIHDIDGLAWITGQPVVEVQAMESSKRTSEGNQAVAIQAALRLANGAIVQLDSGWGLPNEFPTEIDARFRIVCDKGELAVDIHDQGVRNFAGRLSYPGPSSFPTYGLPHGALYNEISTFVRSIEGVVSPPMSMRDAAKAVHVVTAIHRAIESGRTEKV